ncbi:hypothetical protein MY4038_006580 [Beauveria bassiana]
MPVGENPPTVSYSKRHMRSLLAIAFQRWWDAVDRESYHGLQRKAELKKLPELTLQRRQLGYLLAARTHHGDFADYHERFKHEDAELNCPCGRRKSPTYLFYCRKIPRSLRPRLAPEPEAAIRRYLGLFVWFSCHCASAKRQGPHFSLAGNAYLAAFLEQVMHGLGGAHRDRSYEARDFLGVPAMGGMPAKPARIIFRAYLSQS